MRFAMHFDRRVAVGLARATATSVVLLLTATALALSSIRAHFNETLAGFGETVADVIGANLPSTVRGLTVNGLHLEHATTHTRLSLEETVNRVEDLCRRHGGLQELGALAPNMLPPPRPSRLDGVYSQVGKKQGLVVCLDTEHPLSVTEFAHRLGAFARTGNLSALGRLRYVFARREGSLTSVLALWTDGDAPLLQMFPPSGDAPGTDPIGVPRPDGSTRLFSAGVKGMPQQVVVYRIGNESAASMANWYIQGLQERGWAVVSSDNVTMVARQATRNIVVRCTPTDAGWVLASVAVLS